MYFSERRFTTKINSLCQPLPTATTPYITNNTATVPKRCFACTALQGVAVCLSMWKEYTVLALDLPFHGPTDWQDSIYTDRELADVLLRLLERRAAQRCSWMAHSMGGRLVLGVLPHLAPQLDELYLFAPAGFQYVFTGSRIWWPLGLRQWVRRRFEAPEGFVKILEFADRFNLVERNLYLMLLHQVDTPARRARLLRSWASLYYFPMRLTKQHLRLLEQYEIPVYSFYGANDKITPLRYGEQFAKRYPLAEIQQVPGNHFFVKDDLVEPFGKWYAQRSTAKRSTKI